MKLPTAITKLVNWTDRDASRYALGGVRIGRSSGQCFAEATDGRRLALVEWTEKGGEFDAILSGRELGKAARASKRQKPEVTEKVERTPMVIDPFGHKSQAPTATVAVNGQPVPVVEGRWPKTEELFDPSRKGTQTAKFSSAGLRNLARRTPVKVGETTVLLDVNYLNDLADAMDACNCGTVTMHASDEGSQVLCEGDSEAVRLAAILMPMAAD
jgi:hypothetical protein